MPPLHYLATRTLTAAALVLAPPAMALNLVPNGDFESGNTGFTTGYAYVDGGPTSLLPESAYYVGASPLLYHPSFSDYGDHTTGTGNMMIVNGAPDTSIDVWRTASTIPVTPGSLYYFEAWISSAHERSPGALTFGLEGDVSDAILGVGSAPGVTGIWTPLSFTWSSGANTSVSLYLRNANPEPFGNDFAVDDIFLGLRTSISVPDSSGGMELVGLAALSGACCTRRRR